MICLEQEPMNKVVPERKSIFSVLRVCEFLTNWCGFADLEV